MNNVAIDEPSSNVILVLGNGFDIANGYGTKYSDFLSFTKSIKEKKIPENDNEAKYKEIIENNNFIKHFIDYKYKLDTWVDVEKEMHNIVKAIEYIFNDDSRHFKPFNASGLIAISDINAYEKKVLNEFGFVRNSNTQGPQFVASEYYSNEYGIIWENVNKELENQLKGLKLALMSYLKYFMKRGKKQNSINCIKELKPSHIITFNYTDTYKEYYECKDVNHVHGDLENENIVLGYEDDNPKELRYIKFKKYFQRIQNHLKPIDESIFEEYDPFLVGLFEGKTEETKKDNIAHVYGMSLDKTDKDLIKKIYDNVSTFIIYYFDDVDYESKIINLIDIFSKDIVLKDQYNGKIFFKAMEKQNLK